MSSYTGQNVVTSEARAKMQTATRNIAQHFTLFAYVQCETNQTAEKSPGSSSLKLNAAVPSKPSFSKMSAMMLCTSLAAHGDAKPK